MEVLQKVSTRKEYKSQDGHIFDSKKDCELYEKYYNNYYEELGKYIVLLNSWGEELEINLDNMIYDASYCIIKKELSEEFLNFLKLLRHENINYDIYYFYHPVLDNKGQEKLYVSFYKSAEYYLNWYCAGGVKSVKNWAINLQQVAEKFENVINAK